MSSFAPFYCSLQVETERANATKLPSVGAFLQNVYTTLVCCCTVVLGESRYGSSQLED